MSVKELKSENGLMNLNISLAEGPNYFQPEISHHYISIPVCLFSIICIVITIVVALRKGLWRPTAAYLISLAGVDLIALHLLILLCLDEWLSSSYYYSIIYVVASEIMDLFLFSSNWITTILAAERFIAVCYPLKARKIRRKHRKILMIVHFLICLIIKVPSIIISLSSVNIPAFKHFNTWVIKLGLFMFIPFTILAVVNIRLIHAVRKSSQFLKKTDSFNFGCTETSAMNSITNSNAKIHSLKFQQKGEFPEALTKNKKKMIKLNCCFSEKKNSNNNFTDNYATTNQYISTHNAIALTLNGPLANQRRRGLQEERHITMTLICLIIIFFVFQGPFIIYSVYINLPVNDSNVISMSDQQLYLILITVPSQNKQSNSYMIIRSISFIALAMKPLCYFIVYCWFSQRFLSGFKALFKCDLIYQMTQIRRREKRRRRRIIERMHRPNLCVKLVPEPNSSKCIFFEKMNGTLGPDNLYLKSPILINLSADVCHQTNSYYDLNKKWPSSLPNSINVFTNFLSNTTNNNNNYKDETNQAKKSPLWSCISLDRYMDHKRPRISIYSLQNQLNSKLPLNTSLTYQHEPHRCSLCSSRGGTHLQNFYMKIDQDSETDLLYKNCSNLSKRFGAQGEFIEESDNQPSQSLFCSKVRSSNLSSTGSGSKQTLGISRIFNWKRGV